VKILVTGSRKWTRREVILSALTGFPAGSTVIHGAATGADTLAGEVAVSLGYWVREYPADWSLHGKAAGPMRNTFMLERESPFDICLAFPLPGSKGTLDMMRKVQRARVPLVVADEATGVPVFRRLYTVASLTEPAREYDTHEEALAAWRLDEGCCALYSPGMDDATLTRGMNVNYSRR